MSPYLKGTDRVNINTRCENWKLKMSNITFKIEIFVPQSHVETVREAAASAGAGIIGRYDRCASVTEVIGYWRPLEGANPYEGKIGEVSVEREFKVEVNCPRSVIQDVLKAIRNIHPYEEPLINIIPLVNDQF